MEVDRKRGRPAGKNRVPLSMNEKRARNAHYERERRVLCNKAYEELAEVLGCPPQTSNQVILKTATEYIENTPSAESLRQTNEKLSREVQELKQHLNDVATSSRRTQRFTPWTSSSETEEEIKQTTLTKPKKKKKKNQQKPTKSMQAVTKTSKQGRAMAAAIWTSHSPPRSSPSASPSPPPAPKSSPPPPVPISPLERMFVPPWVPMPLHSLIPTATPSMLNSPIKSEPDDYLHLGLNDVEWNEAYKIFPDLAELMP